MGGTNERTVNYLLLAISFAIMSYFLYQLRESVLPQAHELAPAAVVLAVGGLLGVLSSLKWVRGGMLAQPYDLVFGTAFFVVGVLSLYDIVNLYLCNGAANCLHLIPFLDFSRYYAAVFLYVGFVALYRGIRER